ncbi:hypothetical protein GS909_15900 [Rhodococcus hoagii]|nr:hypothetical protein [Prescottella equi]
MTYLDAEASTRIREYPGAGVPPVAPHPARPAPPDGTVLVDDRYELFWSLSFAVRPRVWQRLGGFCGLHGVWRRGHRLRPGCCGAGWGSPGSGERTHFHLHHRVSDPPVEHLDDILRNAAIFERRWGWWPMRGLLDAFESRGLIRFDEQFEGLEPAERRARGAGPAGPP